MRSPLRLMFPLIAQSLNFAEMDSCNLATGIFNGISSRIIKTMVKMDKAMRQRENVFTKRLVVVLAASGLLNSMLFIVGLAGRKDCEGFNLREVSPAETYYRHDCCAIVIPGIYARGLTKEAHPLIFLLSNVSLLLTLNIFCIMAYLQSSSSFHSYFFSKFKTANFWATTGCSLNRKSPAC